MWKCSAMKTIITLYSPKWCIQSFCCIVKSGLSNQNERQSLVMAQAQFLNSPPWKETTMKRGMEEYDRTQLLVVWTEEREKKERRGKRKAWLATTYLSTSFLYWTESEDWAHHWISLSSLLYFLFPRSAWRPCNSRLPLQLPWLFFSPMFFCSQYPSQQLLTPTENAVMVSWNFSERGDWCADCNSQSNSWRWNGLFQKKIYVPEWLLAQQVA